MTAGAGFESASMAVLGAGVLGSGSSARLAEANKAAISSGLIFLFGSSLAGAVTGSCTTGSSFVIVSTNSGVLSTTSSDSAVVIVSAVSGMILKRADDFDVCAVKSVNALVKIPDAKKAFCLKSAD